MDTIQSSIREKVEPVTRKVNFRKTGFTLLAGALAGAIASIPMAGLMLGLDRILPRRKRSWLEAWKPLPPKAITRRVTRRAGLRGLTAHGKNWGPATWLAHLGYGAATASLFPMVTGALPIPRVLRGILYALGVWAGSYLGLLPALGIMAPATKQSARRNTIMILSHLQWGALVALLTGWLVNRFQFQGQSET